MNDIVVALQRVSEGVDVGAVVDDLLIQMTGKKDAPQMMSERQARRLQNVLRHHCKSFQSSVTAVGDAFASAAEGEGLRLKAE